MNIECAVTHWEKFPQPNPSVDMWFTFDGFGHGRYYIHAEHYPGLGWAGLVRNTHRCVAPLDVWFVERMWAQGTLRLFTTAEPGRTYLQREVAAC